jgi:hypothetical protein
MTAFLRVRHSTGQSFDQWQYARGNLGDWLLFVNDCYLLKRGNTRLDAESFFTQPFGPDVTFD